MKSIRLLPGFAAALLSLNLLAGCGMAPKAEAPAQPAATAEDEREPTTLAEAEALLEKARGDLDRLALNQPAPAAALAPPAQPASYCR